MRSLGLAIALALVACGGTPFGACEAPLDRHTAVDSPFLHQSGQALVDAAGDPVQLRAVNLGGWLLFESWMLGGELDFTDLSQGSESQLLARVAELYGEQAAAQFKARIHAEYIVEADFEHIAALGFNAVRLPINHTVVDDPTALARVDQALSWAEQHGLYLILDMHAAPGGQTNLFTADPDEILLWDDESLQDELIADWTQLATRYADSPALGGYDLLNEPDPTDPEALIGLYERLLPAVRAADPHHLVFIEGDDLSRDFALFDRRLDENMAYSPHVYLWIGSPDEAWLDSFARLSDCHDVPIWVGEFGEDGLDDIERLRTGFDAHSGWAIWPWKKIAREGGQPGVAEFEGSTEWLTLMASLTAPPGTAATHTEAEAFLALDAMLQASRTVTVDAEMLAALGLD